MSYTKSFPVSWDQLHRDARALAWRLVDLRAWTGIVAITRGGLVPAAIVARELNLRLIDTVCVETYRKTDDPGQGDQKLGTSNVLKAVRDTSDTLLIVDDLVDTGTTARIVREMLPNAHFATVYAKPAGRPMVDSYVTEVSQDTWILFPWDAELQFAAPVVESQRG